MPLLYGCEGLCIVVRKRSVDRVHAFAITGARWNGVRDQLLEAGLVVWVPVLRTLCKTELSGSDEDA